MSARLSFGFPLSVAVMTDVGRVRTNNEDSHGHAWLDDGSLFVIVADGMGGHEAGEVASGLAVRVVEEVVSREVDSDPRERLYNGLIEANEEILNEGRASNTSGMGTTAITGILRGRQIFIGQVGDSRLFHIRKGQLVWRTFDHTRVQMLLDTGEISVEEARSHPESGMLTRALGHSRMADGRPLVPDVLEDPIEISEDDTVVLSSDGLHDLLEDWEIAQMVAGRTAAEAATELVQAACDRGGHDNVTVAVIVAGSRGQDYDPDFEPEWQEESWEEPGNAAEETYEDLPSDLEEREDTEVEPLGSAPFDAQAEPGGTSMVVGIAAVGAFGIVAAVLAFLAAAGFGAWWYLA
ncbi:MAG: serine/threonine protein phosphatase PrpC [Myxococcota bacterium]|jgi:serine/threonine protein phosphatase PrpC